MHLSLALLTAAVGWAALSRGGDGPLVFHISLILLSAAAVWSSMARPQRDPRSGQGLPTGLAFLVPAYVVLQLVPLPLVLLEWMSPARAELAKAAMAVGAASSWTPISISPATTWIHLARFTACTLTFVTVARLAGHSARSGWIVALPLACLGLLEAGAALAGASETATGLTGTFDSKNHFAGLLEMILPFPVVFAFLQFGRRRYGPPMTGSAVMLGVAAVGCALAIVAAILLSLSKGGVLATFGSLLGMALLVAGRRLSGRSRWAAFAAMAVVAVVLFAFVTPSHLVEQFSVVVSDDQTEGRWPIWQDTLRLIAAYPAVGIGLGNFYPGLLPYQTYGNALAWVNAHNDYLQLVAELGLIGAAVPILLMASVFARAVGLTVMEAAGEMRPLALACVGALLAIAFHSLTDFNTYVFSNALVLSWIAGIAAALPGAPGTRYPEQQKGTGFTLHHGTLAICLALTVGAWGAGSLVFRVRYLTLLGTDRRSCSVGICSTLNDVRFPAGSDPSAAPVRLEPAVVAEFVRRDQADPSLWQDLGEAFQRSGDLERARLCFARAVTLAPNSPTILLMSAGFHFDRGESAVALGLISRALAQGDQRDRAIFAELADRQVRVEDVLRLGLPDKRAAQAYLRNLIGRGLAEDAERGWQSLAARNYLDDRMARDYLNLLLSAGRGESAARDWKAYAGPRDTELASGNLVFNGGFELEPTGTPFDWRIEPVAGVTAEFAKEVRHTGSRALRLRFDGTTNPRGLGVSQDVYLPGGRYRLSAWIKTQGVSTDQGVALRVTSPGRDTSTISVRGTADWMPVEAEIIFGADAVVRLSVARRTSLKFDNLVEGTVWIDGVRISRSLLPIPVASTAPTP